MNTHAFAPFARARRFAFASMLALLLSPRLGAADELAVQAAAGGEPTKDHSGWSINATPVLIPPGDGHGWGGGGDPELKYTLDLGATWLSVGGRMGVYYAKDQFGVSAMPTLRRQHVSTAVGSPLDLGWPRPIPVGSPLPVRPRPG